MPSATSRHAWGAGLSRPSHGTWGSSPGTHAADPFAVNPIRRSFGVVAFSSMVVFGSPLLGDSAATVMMLTVGWLALTGLVMGTPILVWSLAEAGWRRVRRRLEPSVDLLDLSPRLRHVLQRHGYDAIALVERTPDASLLGLSNMDARGLREVRRAVSLWRYRRWQENGFL